MGKLTFAADIDTSNLEKKVRTIDNELKSIAQNAQKSGSLLGDSFDKAGRSAADLEKKTINVGNAMASIGALVSLSVLSDWAKQIANVRGEFQKFEAVLTNTLDGDNVKASSLLQGLSDFAANTPYQLQDITENFVKLANQGIVLTQQELVKLGDFAAVTGKPIGQLFEAIMDVNNPERWKEFGARIATEGEKVMITFRGQKVEFDRTIQGAKDAIAELGSMKGVEGTMNVISKTLIGQISNFQDAWDRMLNELGESNEDTFSGMITGATGLVENYKTIIDVLGAIALTYGAGKAAAILYNTVMVEQAVRIGYVTKMQKGLITWTQLQELVTKRAAAAQAMLNKSMLANPYVMAATALAGMVAGLVILNNKFNESIAAKKNFDDQTKKLSEDYESRISGSDKLIKTIQSETEAESKRVEALRVLKELYPDIFGQIDLHNAKLLNTTEITQKVAETEAARNLQNQREHVASLTRERDKLNMRLNLKSPGTASLGEDGLGNLFPVYDQRKLEQLNALIQQESDRETQMIIDRVNAEQAKREESEKNIQQRIKEADSIQKLGKLREEWEKKWQASTNSPERNKLKGELDLIQKSLDVLSGKTDKKEIEGEYNKLTDLIKKASDAVLNASEAERPALQAKLTALVQQRIAYEDLIKAQRGETTGMKPVKPLSSKDPLGGVQAITKEQAKQEFQADKLLKKAAAKTVQAQKEADAIKGQNDQYTKQAGALEDLTNGLGDAGELLGAISYAAGEFDSTLGQSVGKMADIASNAAKMVESYASGNMIGAIASGVGIIGNIVGLVRSGKEDPTISAMEKVNNLLEQQSVILADINEGENYFALAAKQINDYTIAIDLNNKKLQQRQLLTKKEWEEMNRLSPDEQLKKWQSGWQPESVFWTPQQFVKAFADGTVWFDEQTTEWIADITEKQKQRAELLQNTFRQALGFDASDISDSIFQGIEDGLKLGENSLGGFAENFGDLIKIAVMQGVTEAMNIDLTNEFLPKVKEFLQNSEVGPNGEKFTERELDILEKIYAGKVNDGQQMADALKPILDKYGSSASTQTPFTGTQIGASQESVSLLTGQISAARLDIKAIENISQSQLELMDQSLSVLGTIAANTKPIYRLEAIETSIAETNRILKERL